MMEEDLLCGALNPYTLDVQEYEEAIQKAKDLYIRIRNDSDDYLKIADRTGYSVEQVLMVKHYIFFNIHQLNPFGEIEYRQFDPDLSMAHSWFRLSGADKPSSKLSTIDNKGIASHDYVLLDHELFEMKLLIDGACNSQAEAHKVAEQAHNYYNASKKFYEELETFQRRSGKRSSPILKPTNAFLKNRKNKK